MKQCAVPLSCQVWMSYSRKDKFISGTTLCDALKLKTFLICDFLHRHLIADAVVVNVQTATYLQYRVIGLTPMVVGLSQSLAQRSGTVSRISSGTRQSALTLSDVCWRRICLRDTSACSALEVDNFMRYINLLTYLLTYKRSQNRAARSSHQHSGPGILPSLQLARQNSN